MGAWIETLLFLDASCYLLVAPLWERGLKLAALLALVSRNSRSLMGAWIETSLMCCCVVFPAVAPLWERGLKHAGRKLRRP